MKLRRYHVTATHHCAIPGEADYVVGESDHWTLLGADFHRRFRMSFSVMGWCTIRTDITRNDGRSISRPEREWVWAPVYWVRARCDGLRYGLDRDAR